MSFPRRFAATRRFSLGAPRNIRVTSDGKRVIFCRSDTGDDPVNKLWVLDVASGIEQLIADPTVLLAAGGKDMSEAEKARRERAREAGGGIVTYALTADESGALFVVGGLLFRAELSGGEPTRIEAEDGVFDPRPDPTDTRVAYVAGNELRVTGDGAGDRSIIGDLANSAKPDAVSWGSAEFIAAEEMGRSRGFWWGPDGDRLLVTRVDTTPVAQWWISSPAAPQRAPRSIPYPAAGTANATVDLFFVDLDGSTVPIDWRGNEFEYLAGASWGAANPPTLTVQTRDQRTLAVLTVDPETGQTTEIHRQHDDHWIELMPGVPAWTDDRLVTSTIHDNGITLAVDGSPIGAADFQVRSVVRLTSEAAIVTGSSEPTELHIAELPYDGSAPRLLTEGQAVHRVAVGGSTRVTSTSSLHRVAAEHRVESDLAGATAHGTTIQSNVETPTVTPNVEIISCGERSLRTAVLLPADHDGSPLPVLMDPYGGPHAQRVLQAQSIYLTSQWFADQGYAVVVTDGRGTPGRGSTWEREVWGDLAAPVLDDQIDALAHVAARYPIDTDRVAIRGWSFGGYLAALAVLRRPDIFHAAVAGAPVTDWRLYDTHYTERYLGHPDTVPDHYAQTNLCAEAAKLTRPLMLVHGLADDNVVAAHTLALSQALLEAGRPHTVLPLSDVTHMTPQEEVAENLLKLQLAFIDQALGVTR